MYILVVYVPETHLEVVKEALFEAGAGQIGDYRRCSWQVRGMGQFEPGEGSSPFIGDLGRLEELPEYRVEIACPDQKLKSIAAALVEAHPYEEPAYHFYRGLSLLELPGGDSG
ncbi:MAG TPA: NGG1p interacting factor NIF3 [Sediminispirochaeta sp.]|nr:NGG1p interacting factor NIF3 [Sediminispirochaeta sp.]